MYPPTPGFHDFNQDVQIEARLPTQVNKFRYLGSTDAKNNWLVAELDRRTSNASCTVQKLGRYTKRMPKDFTSVSFATCVKYWISSSGQNKFILAKSKLAGINDIFTQCKLRWSGHSNRLEDSSLPKQILYFLFTDELRITARQKLRHKDIIKKAMCHERLCR